MDEIEIKNAKIEGTMLGTEDHGILTAYLYLDYGDAGHQGFGGYGFDGWVEAKKKRIGVAWGMEFVKQVLETVGVEKWEDLPDKFIRVKAGWSKVQAIGNITKNKWFDPTVDLRYLLPDGHDGPEERRWSNNYCEDLSAVTAENAGLRGRLAEAQREIRILMDMQFPFGDGGWCCGLRDMGIGIHEAGCPVAAKLGTSEVSSVEARDETSTAQEDLFDDCPVCGKSLCGHVNYCPHCAVNLSEVPTAAQEEIKELEADLRSSEAEENAAWDEADKWQERAENVGRAAWKLIGYLRHADKDPYHDGEGCPVYDALPAWMRREIEK